MTTVLQIAQRSMYELALPAPSALFAATDANSRQILNLIYALARELRNTMVFPQQRKTYSFDTEANRSKYPFPADFYASTIRTVRNQDTRRELNGPTSGYLFNLMQYGTGNLSYEISYRAFGADGALYTPGGQFEIYPTPTAGGTTLSYEYITGNLFIPKYWLPSTAYTSGQYVSSNGLIYLCDTNGTSDTDTGPATTAQDITDGTARWDYQSILYDTIKADTDLCIFDDDLMIAGLKAMYLEARNMETAEIARSRYNNLLTGAKARWEGNYIGSFSRRRAFAGPRYRPDTDGGWNI